MSTELAELRARLWDQHPIVREAAALPTASVQNAIGAVLHGSRKSRFSHAFYADPSTGKSTCLDALEHHIATSFSQSGVYRYEAMKEDNSAEGRLLEDMILQLNVGVRVARTLAAKRDQLNRALLALSGPGRHLFFLIDEAQELHERELNWLKGVINKVLNMDVKVTTVLMGQRQLMHRVRELERADRRDLLERFFKRIIEFKGCCAVADFSLVCDAIDNKSEYPEGSGYSYTQFLFPQAYASGFRFQKNANPLWQALIDNLPSEDIERGISMEIVASYIAQTCVLLKDRDGAWIEIENSVLQESVEEAFT